MKFFFRITDINTVTERFDYFGPKPPIVAAIKEEKPAKTVRFQLPEKKNRATPKKPVIIPPKTSQIPEEITEAIKNRIQKEPLSEKGSVYTNITLNRSNNVEIITKIQKVSNKNGQPIGLNIIKQTVKKSKPPPVPVKQVEKPELKPVVKKEEPEPILPAPVPMEVDLEKSNFLKSIELTAKTSLPAVSPQKVIALDNKPSVSSQKRKNSSPVKSVKKSKVLKLNPAVRQIVSNVNQSATNVTKIVERNAPNKDLQTLFDNCKINIPSSLSITVKEDSNGEPRTPVSVKPVQNYIEILRLPDSDVKQSARRSPQTFQKMFEEAIKKPDFTKALTTQKTALDLSDNTKKSSIAEIAQQLHKKTKLENGKVSRVNQKSKASPEQSVDCHSASLGMNYKISVGQNGTQSPPNKVVSSSIVSPSANKSVLPKPTSSLSITTTTNTPASQSLSPNQLLEKYNIQNLAQLTASFNLNPANLTNFGAAALQQAMILKHFEMQNRQNWLNMNPSPLVQYEKYLKSLQGKNQLLGKEN